MKEILVFDSTYEDYGYAYGGSIPVKKGGMWGAVNYDNEVIVLFEYTGFYSSPDNLGNFVLYNSGEYFLFDNQGNVLYQGEDEVRASGGLYITCHYDEEYMSLIAYHRLDGSELVSWKSSEDATSLTGFYEGISNLYGYLNDGLHIGTVDMQGNLSWMEDSEYYYYNPPQNNSGWGAVSVYEIRPILSTMNHGYYVTGAVHVWPDILPMYDTSENKIATVEYARMTIDGNGAVNIDEDVFSFSNGYRGFWVDGFTLANYGAKMVFKVDDKNVLVDLARNTAGGDSVSMDVVTAVYDYISMADENYWLVQSGEQWGYIDHDGNEEAMFEDAGPFVGGYALVIEDSEAWLIDEEFHKLQNLGHADSVSTIGELYCVRIGDDMHLYQLQ